MYMHTHMYKCTYPVLTKNTYTYTYTCTYPYIYKVHYASSGCPMDVHNVQVTHDIMTELLRNKYIK